MERSDFLQLSAFASLFALKNKNIFDEPAAKAFVVQAGKDRHNEELHIMGGVFDCKISSKDTNGALLMYDTVRHAKGGPALHLHYAQDELFYIIKGEFIVKVGEETFNLKPGDLAFAPRKVPHAFAKISEGEGQMLVLFQPAGSMEDFFLQASKVAKEIPKDQEKVLKELWETHGMKLIGPPLTF
jgi:mannose-6-phosphate isomerase-like protein (cupin superfamily)